MSALVMLWSAPRSRSTAFFRAMVERGDFLGVHEPFCNLVDHGETTVGERLVRSDKAVIDALLAQARGRPVFVKETTDYRYPRVLADRRLLTGATHTFLVRRPEEIAGSFYALKPDMSRDDIGLEALYEVFVAVRSVTGRVPVVIDSDDLVERPEETVAAYCAAIGVAFRPEALSWQPGERPEWQRSARWHVAASRSTGFAPAPTRYEQTVANNAMLAAYSAHHRPFYERLLEARMPVPGR
jgi:hypothetical protein